MSSDGTGGGGPDEKATIVAGPSFDELLAKRAEAEALGAAPTDEPPSWSQDMAFAATAMGQSYDDLLAEKGLSLPSDVPPPAAGSPPPAAGSAPPRVPAPAFPAPAVPVPGFPAASPAPAFGSPGPSQPELPQPFGTAPTAPPPAVHPAAAQPPGVAPGPFGAPAGTPQYTPAPHTPAPQHTPAPVPAPTGQGGKPPLAATMALDMSQTPIFAPHLDPNAQANALGAPASSPMAPYGAPPMAPVPAASAPAPKSKLLLFAVTFAAVFVIGSICFGGMAIFFLM